jgi:1,4-dihydroxy-2-naphthoate octaprenyltransferase
LKIPKILRIIRVHIVLGGAVAFSLGALLAVALGGSFNVAVFGLGYLVVLLGDLSTHFSNDYFDVDVDKNSERRKFSSGTHVLVTNPELKSLAKSVSISLFLLANVLAVSLVVLFGVPSEFFLIFLGASIAGWIYSAPPFRLVSRGLGEIIIAVVTGFAIPALGYLAVKDQFDVVLLCFSVPFMMYGLFLSLSLEVPDVEADQRGLKNNFAVRNGIHAVFSLVLILAVAATVAFLLYYWLIPTSSVNIAVVAVFSLVPLGAAVSGYVGLQRQRPMLRFAAVNIVSLFAFNLLMIGYLAVTIVGM